MVDRTSLQTIIYDAVLTADQCDQVFSGEITTSGFKNYYFRAKITTVPYFSNLTSGGGGGAKNVFRTANFSGDPPLKLGSKNVFPTNKTKTWPKPGFFHQNL